MDESQRTRGAIQDVLTEQIISCCFEVHNALGGGFMEKVYENALAFELRQHGLRVMQQAPVSVSYKGQIVGQYVADLLVEGRVVCELKAASDLSVNHELQLLNYLSASGFETGLLINFGRKVAIRRKYRAYKPKQEAHRFLPDADV
jgi:GxxExxY protein